MMGCGAVYLWMGSGGRKRVPESGDLEWSEVAERT